MRRFLLPSITLATLLLFVALAAGLWFKSWAATPLSEESGSVRFVVEPGDTMGALSRRMANSGLIKNPRLMDILARLSGADESIHAGEYEFALENSPTAILLKLRTGQTLKYQLTLPEGIALAQALRLIQTSEGIVSVLSGVSDQRVLDLVAPFTTGEGYFLPETYQYERGFTDLAILEQAHGLMNTVLGDVWQARDPSLPYESPYEVLVMASIIEKETGVAFERPEIAGVFVRRIQKGMRLQTDPTVIYGLGEKYDGDLRRSHLKDDTNPYNTYRHFGLPPSPIALPGRKALEAAVQPAPGDALYFVAKGDGSHQFSATLEEHEAAVKTYQLQRRANYRSSPAPSVVPDMNPGVTQ